MINKNKKLNFGKYSGQRISDITDMGYLRWIYQNTKLDYETKKTLQWKLNIK